MPGFRLYPGSVRPLLAVAALLLLAGCGPGAALIGPGTPAATEQARSIPPAPATVVEAQLLDAASEWMGTPYRFGGTTRSGVDCSALVRAVYAGAFGLHLTRATRTQVHEGRPIRKQELRTGDLVFFRTGPDQRHVGIYLDGDRLLHASSSQNRVLVDDFNQRHFQQTYWTARRLLDVQPDAPAAPPIYAEAPPAEPPRSDARPAPVRPGPERPAPIRSGW